MKGKGAEIFSERKFYFELFASLQESGARFDEKLKKLSELKVRVESAVGQEQLNILRMRQETLRNLQMNKKEEQIK